ncbi:MAG: hypothetical protein ACOZDD_16080 [Bacteroidota bacterium]
MDKNLKVCIMVITLLVAASCNIGFDRDKIPLAKVGDKTLYLDDLRSVLPSGLSYDDSIMMAEDYIKKWVMNELLVKKAEENLSPSQKDMAKELMEYRNSMLTYRYKMELMFQKLDTLVDEREMKSYYDQNKDNFILGRDIVKAIFIKIPAEVSRPEQVKVFCEQVSDDSIRELQEFCLKFAITYDIFIDNWVEFERIAQNLPEQLSDPEKALRRNNILEFRDSEFYYVLCVNDYRLAGNIAPIEYVEGNIRNLVINRRRIDFLKKIEDDVYLEGIRNNKFKLYSYEPEAND